MCLTTPAVFAVDESYQIMVRCEEETTAWVKVGDRCFFDHSNGILRSGKNIHRLTVPAALLDKAGAYTVCTRKMLDRKPYFTETGDVEEKTYEFRAVKGDVIRAYHIADAHNQIEAPALAAAVFGEFDFLILNGDIPDHSGTVKNFDNIYELCGKITKGNIPIVFARGNHDLRGVHAEDFEYYTPQANGKTYFTVKLGGFWALVLDCGEDKNDEGDEYGHTICCHAFRMEENDFIEKVISEKKFLSDEIFCRAVIVHNPFTRRFKPPFNIEEELYDDWKNKISDNIKPDVMLCGHTHKISVDMPGENGAVGFPVVTLSENDHHGYFSGAGIEFNKNGKIKITVTDSYGNVKEKIEL